MPPLLSSVRAQPTAVETLQRALASGRVHHAYLFDGPEGVGKERAAFGLAQALVCERRVEGQSDACGACRACGRAAPRDGEPLPLHPDVVVIERGRYDPEAIGRDRDKPEKRDISIDQVRTLVLARAAFAPHEGRARVFLVRRADELSTEAANALLKVLEEPGARTHFVLLSSTPDTLLPTIRSRAQRVRFGALPDGVVAELLAERGVERARAAEVARLAGGSMATAVVLADPEASARRDRFVASAMSAIDARDASGAYEIAEEAKQAGKEEALAHIDALAAALAGGARATAASSDRRADAAAARHTLALAAMRQIESNASLQLAIESMMLKMRAV